MSRHLKELALLDPTILYDRSAAGCPVSCKKLTLLDPSVIYSGGCASGSCAAGCPAERINPIRRNCPKCVGFEVNQWNIPPAESRIELTLLDPTILHGIDVEEILGNVP